MGYELVAGLETHIELSTATKIFCACTTKFGAEPNTNCCPICIGLPGTLPKLNRQVVNYAIKAGLVTNCKIREVSKMDRKNYVYPDLSKAYQISQYDKPLCQDGHIDLDSGRTIRINRIHIEEDAGKLIHTKGDTFVDYNRGGVPLIEIVTEPDIRSIEEVKEYLEKLQLMMKYIGVSDCKMQEGSMRCDVNVSVRKTGASELGTRAEIKNMNSFVHIAKAIEYEFERQVDLIESGQNVVQETRRFDVDSGVTQSMRGKEDAHDYRYFRDPDLVSIVVTKDEIENIRKMIPELPEQKQQRYVDQLGIPQTDAALISRYKQVAELFDAAADGVKNPKTVSNFIIGQIFSRLVTEEDKETGDIPVTAENLKELVLLIDDGKIGMNIAKKTLETMMDKGCTCHDLISEADLAGVDESQLEALCKAAVDTNQKAVSDYMSGKDKAVKSIVGQIMRDTKGRANAQLAEEIIIKIINR